MRSSSALVLTAASAALLASLSLSADAADGGALRIGAHNDAGSTTALVNHGDGAALRLDTRPGAPPLRVSSSRRVTRLNADRVDGLDDVEGVPTAYVLHAGTALDGEGTLVSSGGRVLSVVARGADLHEARERAYAAVDHVELEGSHHRGDIALRASRGEVTVG